MRDNKKYIVIFGIIAVLLILILIAKVFKKDNFEERLVTYITSKNYVKDVGTMYAYNDTVYPYELCSKANKDCLGKTYYFNTATYELVLDELLKSEGVEFMFTPTYHYSNSKTTYYYRVSYNNGTIVIKGDYNKNDFTCDVEYSYGIDVYDKNAYCGALEERLESFNSYARLLIDDMSLLNRMQDKK